MSEWIYKSFGDVCSHSAFGPRFSSDEYAVDGNVACLRTMDIDSHGRIDYDAMPLAKLDLKRLASHVLEPGDLVITRTGAYLGKVGLFEAFRLPVLAGAFSIRFRIDESTADPLFLKYFFNGKQGQEGMQSIATGSAQPNLNIPRLHSLTVPCPHLPEQWAIAGVLSSLDDKIDLLHRQNKTLEAIAETLFRQWFVEEASEDWEEVSLGSLVTHVKKGIKPSDEPEKVYHHYSLPAFDIDRSPVVESGSVILSNKYDVTSGSILISKLNPRFPRIWPVRKAPENSICSTEFQVLKPVNGKLFGYVYFLLCSAQARDELSMAASGTSGSHQRVRPEDILNISCTFPSESRAIEFSATVDEFLNKFDSNALQISTLEKLRDTLLPKLMSGEVRVQYD